MATATPQPLPPVAAPEPLPRSRAAGLPWSGRLVHGRQLPLTGPGFATWDPILKQVGNRPWRRWGTDRLLRTLHRVLGAYAQRHPDAPPVLVGDLSRPHGGDFGPRFGGIGHASHQNGLDADVYYPRLDRRLRRAWRPDQVDRAAAQELVDAFVAEGARVRVRRPVARPARAAQGRADAHAPRRPPARQAQGVAVGSGSRRSSSSRTSRWIPSKLRSSSRSTRWTSRSSCSSTSWPATTNIAYMPPSTTTAKTVSSAAIGSTTERRKERPQYGQRRPLS